MGRGLRHTVVVSVVADGERGPRQSKVHQLHPFRSVLDPMYVCMCVFMHACDALQMRRRDNASAGAKSSARRCGSRTREHRAHARGRVCACSACPPDGASLRLRRLLQLELIGHARDVVGRHSAPCSFFSRIPRTERPRTEIYPSNIVLVKLQKLVVNFVTSTHVHATPADRSTRAHTGEGVGLD